MEKKISLNQKSFINLVKVYTFPSIQILSDEK